MSKRRTASEWDAVLRAYRRSGLTQAEFCHRQGIAVATLSWRLRRDRAPVELPRLVEILTPAAPGSGPEADMARIELGSPRGPLTVHCPCGRVAAILAQLTAPEPS